LALPAGSGGARVKLQFALFAVVLSGCAGQPPAQQPAPDASAVSTAAPSGGAAAAAATTDQPNQKYIKLGYNAVRYDDGYVYCREDAHVGTLLRSKNCYTAETLEKQEQAAKDILNSSRAILPAQDPSASLPH